ncbi:MAG: hypothetical protein U0412_07150 [Nitrospira sp.]
MQVNMENEGDIQNVSEKMFHESWTRLSQAMLSRRLLIVLAVVLAWTGCSSETSVTVANHSSRVASNIVVSGSGFSEHINHLAAGAEYRLSIHPRGESGARVAFDAGDRHIDIGEQGYFEGGGSYRVVVIIEPDLKVTVSSQLRGY